MIYEQPASDAPVRQGDIFKSLPLVSIEPEELIVISPSGINKPTNWLNETNKQTLVVSATITPSYGIVISQDCDAAGHNLERDPYIAFFQIVNYEEYDSEANADRKPKWWADTITRKSRMDQKWFYLPPDPRIGFLGKMAVVFRTIIPVKTQFILENRASLRIGRLIHDADEHFREQVSQYFRRYPYDEWYPLNKEEFEAYKSKPTRADSQPFPWQE